MSLVAGKPEMFAWLLFGFFVGILLYEWLDPPPPEVVEAISQSEWARAWAEAYVSKNIPPELRKELIDKMARHIAERMAMHIFG